MLLFLPSLLLLPSLLSAPSPLFEKAKALVLISFDGFRFDTLNSTIAPNITAWAEGGVLFTKGVQPQASTVTAPNHYSIVTGLYEEAHGIIGNIFFDAERRKFYDIYNLSSIPGTVEESLNPYWYTSETIWQSNRKAGGHSAVVHWPIGDVASGNDNETHFYAWREHGNLSKWQDEVEVVINSILEGKNLVAWYISEPDHTLHTHGFYHDGHYRTVMADLDVTFGYFLNRLKILELLDTTDIIFTADHGHAEISSLDVVLCMDDHIKGQIGVDYQVSDYTVLAYTEQQAIEVFESLTKAVAEKNYPVKVMWTKDVPAEWHFSHPSRLGQVMVVPEIGADARFKCPWKDPATFHSSTHGHAPENAEMRAVLAMRGPSFAEKRTIVSIPQNIDLFPLMGKVLGIRIPANNGTLERVESALRPLPSSTEPTVEVSSTEEPKLLDSNVARVFNILLILMPIAVLSMILYYIIMRVKRGPNKQLAADLTNEATEPML